MISREELLEREDGAWSELVTAIAAVPADRLPVEGVVPGWSVHDLVWRCAYWAAHTGDQLERLQGDGPGTTGGEGEDAAEAEILVTGRGLEWDEVMLKLEQSRDRARAAFSAIVEPSDAAVALFTEDAFGTTKSTRPRSVRSAPDPGADRKQAP